MHRTCVRWPRQVFGLPGEASSDAGSNGHRFPGALRPVLMVPVVPGYRCGAAPELAVEGRTGFPLSLPRGGVGTIDDHKIVWLYESVNTRCVVLLEQERPHPNLLPLAGEGAKRAKDGRSLPRWREKLPPLAGRAPSR